MASIDEVLMTDISFTDDLGVSDTGDIATVSGLANLRNAILRRILTVPGSLVHRPLYGCGLLEMQNAPMTLSVKRQLANRLAQQLPQDPRVTKVVALSVESDDATPGRITVIVKVLAVGIGETVFTLEPFSEVSI